jgi:hypothetical protein
MCVCEDCYKWILLYYSCYFFNLYVDCFRLEHSLGYAFYHVLKKKITTLKHSCYVRGFDRNLAVECKMCETSRTLPNVGRND